jgi:hypothetical protein
MSVRARRRALACLFPQKPETGSLLTGPKEI